MWGVRYFSTLNTSLWLRTGGERYLSCLNQVSYTPARERVNRTHGSSRRTRERTSARSVRKRLTIPNTSALGGNSLKLKQLVTATLPPEVRVALVILGGPNAEGPPVNRIIFTTGFVLDGVGEAATVAVGVGVAVFVAVAVAVDVDVGVTVGVGVN